MLPPVFSPETDEDNVDATISRRSTIAADDVKNEDEYDEHLAAVGEEEQNVANYENERMAEPEPLPTDVVVEQATAPQAAMEEALAAPQDENVPATNASVDDGAITEQPMPATTSNQPQTSTVAASDGGIWNPANWSWGWGPAIDRSYSGPHSAKVAPAAAAFTQPQQQQEGDGAEPAATADDSQPQQQNGAVDGPKVDGPIANDANNAEHCYCNFCYLCWCRY